MSDSIPRYLLMACAGLFTLFGFWGLVSPEGMAAMISVKATGPDGVHDLRAMYGGLELAWAAVLGWHALDEDRVRTGLVFAGIAIGSLGLVRLLSQLLAGFTGLSMFLVAAELGTAVLCAWFSRNA